MNDQAEIMYDMELAVQTDTGNDLYRRFQREVLDSWNEYRETHSECDEYFEDEEVPHFEAPEIPLSTVNCAHPVVRTERMFKQWGIHEGSAHHLMCFQFFVDSAGSNPRDTGLDAAILQMSFWNEWITTQTNG